MNNEEDASYTECSDDLNRACSEIENEQKIKVKMIHDLIIDKVEYNQTLYDNNFKDEDTAYSQSAYSVFCTDLTVCAGYSQASIFFCQDET